jgi:hypothetical protein
LAKEHILLVGGDDHQDKMIEPDFWNTPFRTDDISDEYNSSIAGIKQVSQK